MTVTVSPPRLVGALQDTVGRLRTIVVRHVVALVVLGVLIVLVGVPLYFMIDLSFREGTPANPGFLTLENYRRVYGSSQTASALLNTAIYAVAVSAISLSMAVLFAWLIERTDMPGRNFAWVAMLLPIAIPGMLMSMAWVLLLSSKIGILNIGLRWFSGLLGHDMSSGPLDIYSLPGLVFVEGFRGSTGLFLIVVAAFRLMDPSMEEAASIAGAGTWYTMRKITMKLMAPALLAAGMYSLIGNLDDLEGPLIIGVPAGIFLLPTLIYFTASRGGDWGLSAAYSTIFLLITVVMVVIYYLVILRRRGNFATVTGKAFRPRRISLGKWRYAGLACFIVYFLIMIALPLAVLIWASLLPAYQVPSMDALGKLSFSNYADILSRPEIEVAVWNTVKLAVLSATATMILAFFVSWLVIRLHVRGGILLDGLVFMPHAIPTIAIAIALVAFYLSPTMGWTNIYGTVVIMVLAMLIRLITFATRTTNGAMSQLNKELEEVAYTSGVGRLRTLSRITFRLLIPAFIAGWIYIAASSIRNLSIPLLLASNNNGTIASTLYFYWYRNSDFSGAAALGILMLLVLAILAVGARRMITSGYSESK